MNVLLEISWSPEGKHLVGALRVGDEPGDAIAFRGTLELVARVEELLDAEPKASDGSQGQERCTVGDRRDDYDDPRSCDGHDPIRADSS